jgi:DNA-3-methyladenine glycosylase
LPAACDVRSLPQPSQEHPSVSDKPRRPRPKKLGPQFFDRDAAGLAHDLIGKILVRKVDGEQFRARIVETEAYVGPHDLACHAAKGRTNRTEVMFGPPGRAYVYFIYGVYDMLNIVTGPVGDAQAVLIRAAEPLDGWQADLSGPGKLTRAMRITRADNGLPLWSPTLFLQDDPADRPRVGRSRRVGVDYAKEWRDAHLRFHDVNSTAVSRPRPQV